MTHSRARIPFAIAGILIIAGIWMLSERPPAALPLETHAAQMLERCASAPSRQRCYDVEIPKLMDTLAIEEVFAVTRLVQTQDPTYWFCHELAHNVSEREYDKNPAGWKEVVTRCPVGMCSNGCIHGTMQRHFISESLNNAQLEEVMPVLETVCEKRANWNPTPQEQSSCYHELGHLSLYLTESDPARSVAVCERISVHPDGRDYRQTCREGIFMQVFEPRDTEDFRLIYHLIPNKEGLKECEDIASGVEKGACWEREGWSGGATATFCRQFPDEAIQWSCFREGWVTEDKKKIRTPEGIVSYCGYSGDAQEQRKCYNKLFYSVMALTEFDTDLMKELCSGMPTERKGQCFANTASRLIETDQRLMPEAAAICAFAAVSGVEEECYKELVHYANFVAHPGTEQALRLCGELPDPWRTRCKTNDRS